MAASTLPAAVPASEPTFAASRWHNPYAILPAGPAAADIISPYSTDTSGWKAQDPESGDASFTDSFSGSSTSSGHCLGRIPAGLAPPQGTPTMPETPQSPKTDFINPNLMPPMTADWGCSRPVHSQQQPRSHHHHQSAQALPSSFATQQQCLTIPGHSLTTPQHFSSSLEQACVVAQQQRELLYGHPRPVLVAPQQSPSSSYTTFQQLQLLRQRLGSTSNTLLNTHHPVIAGAGHASGLQPGQPCFEGGIQALGQQLNYATNVGPQHTYIPTQYSTHTGSRAGVQPRNNFASPDSRCTPKTGQQASPCYW